MTRARLDGVIVLVDSDLLCHPLHRGEGVEEDSFDLPRAAGAVLWQQASLENIGRVEGLRVDRQR